MRNILPSSILVAFVATSNLHPALAQESSELVAKQLNNTQPVKLLLKNRFLELTFDPTRGGRCSRLVIKATGEQVIGNESVSGMFLDHWAKYAWPSGLMHLPYQYELVKEGKQRVGVRLWVKVPKLGGGKGTRDRASSSKMVTSPDLVGLTIRKTIWLSSDHNAIQVEQEILNTTQQSRSCAIYIQQNLQMNGSHYSENWYLPSTNGVEVHMQPDEKGGRVIGPDFIQTPTAGWMAVKDRKTHHWMIFAFDYNYLNKTYTSGGTWEWFMEPVPIGPGKSFRTDYLVKPVSGFQDFVFASRNIVADIQADEVGSGQVKITHDILAVEQDQSDLTITLQAIGWRSKKLLAEKSFKVSKLSSKRLRQQLTFKPAKLADGIVISAIVSSERGEERYERYYAGERAEQEARTNLFATRGGALPSGRADRYFRPQPRKRKQIDKPDFSKLTKRDPNKFRCLVVYGLYTHILKLDDAVEGWKHREKAVEFTWANCPPNGVETFPGTYDELFQFDVIVLSDVNYRALGDIAMEMICDYVEQGGSLLVAGGPYAYGNGEFQGSRFLDVLPVRLRGPFDLKWAGKHKSWKLTSQLPNHSLLKGVSFDQSPRVFWHHFVTPKSDAKVVLKADSQPTLVLGRYGKGRVAVLTLSPTGLARPGQVAWWDWNGWFPLVQNLFAWLKEDKPADRTTKVAPVILVADGLNKDGSLVANYQRGLRYAINYFGNYGPYHVYLLGSDNKASVEEIYRKRALSRINPNAPESAQQQIESFLKRPNVVAEMKAVLEGKAEGGLTWTQDPPILYEDVTTNAKGRESDPIENTWGALHEYHHVFQMAHCDTKQKRSSDKHINSWMAEGMATYSSAKFMENLGLADFKGYMLDLRKSGGNIGRPSINEFLAKTRKWELHNETYWEEGGYAQVYYMLGAWATAYLIHVQGVDEVTVLKEWYHDIPRIGKSASFKKHMGLTLPEFYEKFDKFIRQSDDEVMQIFDAKKKAK